MGCDVTIYFKTTDGKKPKLERDLNPKWFEIETLEEHFSEYGDYEDYDHPKGATHIISSMMRFYGVGYERGDWGEISRVLMLLHACETVKKVWYGHDCEDAETMQECPIDRVMAISAHYMRQGERPYRSHFKRGALW